MSKPNLTFNSAGFVADLYPGGEWRKSDKRFDDCMAGFNRELVSDLAAPFGGAKQSGVGRQGGHEEMLEFLENSTPWPVGRDRT